MWCILNHGKTEKVYLAIQQQQQQGNSEIVVYVVLFTSSINIFISGLKVPRRRFSFFFFPTNTTWHVVMTSQSSMSRSNVRSRLSRPLVIDISPFEMSHFNDGPTLFFSSSLGACTTALHAQAPSSHTLFSRLVKSP